MVGAEPARSRILVHVVTFNSARWIARCVESVRAQTGFTLGEDLFIHITDNASTDGTAAVVSELEDTGVTVELNPSNFGFCGGHNQGARRFLDQHFDFLLILNPDIRLEPQALKHLVSELEGCPAAGAATPKLLRADENLSPVSPPTFDAAGMILTSSLRHFDRGSGEHDVGQYEQKDFVFGGTGACLLLRRSYVIDLAIEAPLKEFDSERVYPVLGAGRALRAPLFDEAFFAYREDADLSWRGDLLGWKTLYVPSAVGYHKRAVVPENRAELPPELNAWSVRNRFLLQLNNYSPQLFLKAMVPGVLVRNCIVLLGALLKERTSLPAFSQIAVLFKRALERRAVIFNKRQARGL